MDTEDEFDDHFEPWTESSAATLLAAGDALADAVRMHALALAESSEAQNIQAVFTASDVLLPIVLAYADAQFNLTGNGFPFGVLRAWADDEEGDSETGEEEPVVGTGLSVLSRQDFLVTDKSAVLAGGRTAYQ